MFIHALGLRNHPISRFRNDLGQNSRNSRVFRLFNCENDMKISFSGCFQHDASPGIKSVLVIALELILDSVQDLDLKKCGYFWRLSYTKLPHCRTV